MENIQKLNERLESLGEETNFNDVERTRLQRVFKDGKLDENICRAGWVRFVDNDGEPHYTSHFSQEVTDCMIQIVKERIEKVEREAEQLYENFSLQLVADYLNNLFKEFVNTTWNSDEWRRIRKCASKSKADVECGKCNYEGVSPSYNCVVVRENDYYSWLVKIEKDDCNGYIIETKGILCGSTRFKCDKTEIFKHLKETAESMCL